MESVSSGDSIIEFYVGYDPASGLFKALTETDRGTWMQSEVSTSLPDLFNRCKASGLTFNGEVTEKAAEMTHKWLVLRPAIDFINELWEDQDPNRKQRPIGFRHES